MLYERPQAFIIARFQNDVTCHRHSALLSSLSFCIFFFWHANCPHSNFLHLLVQDVSHENIPIMLVGNKADLRKQTLEDGIKCVPTSYGEKLAMVRLHGSSSCKGDTGKHSAGNMFHP